jgi:hypothetical protein
MNDTYNEPVTLSFALQEELQMIIKRTNERLESLKDIIKRTQERLDNEKKTF